MAWTDLVTRDPRVRRECTVAPPRRKWDGGTVGFVPARMRLAWFAAIVFVAVFGLGNLAIWIGESIRGPSWWAIDFTTYDAARRVIDGGTLYTDPKYLYPPVGSLLGFPFLVVDRFTASLVLALGKVLIAAVCVHQLT